MDLTLKFDTQEILAALVEELGEIKDGEVLSLSLAGALKEEAGGTEIEGSDCVLIIKRDDNGNKGGKKK